ncbi:hypothetical protein SGRIM128S_06421 [Streptomyces griseomycini]
MACRTWPAARPLPELRLAELGLPGSRPRARARIRVTRAKRVVRRAVRRGARKGWRPPPHPALPDGRPRPAPRCSPSWCRSGPGSGPGDRAPRCSAPRSCRARRPGLRGHGARGAGRRPWPGASAPVRRGARSAARRRAALPAGTVRRRWPLHVPLPVTVAGAPRRSTRNRRVASDAHLFVAATRVCAPLPVSRVRVPGTRRPLPRGLNPRRPPGRPGAMRSSPFVRTPLDSASLPHRGRAPSLFPDPRTTPFSPAPDGSRSPVP